MVSVGRVGDTCLYHFLKWEAETAVKRAFAMILYVLGKSSYGFIAKFFGVTPSPRSATMIPMGSMKPGDLVVVGRDVGIFQLLFNLLGKWTFADGLSSGVGRKDRRHLFEPLC